MRRLIRKRFNNSGSLLALLLIILFYTEIMCYYLNTYNWYTLNCNDETLCTKILLVADPQLIGKQNEKIHFLTPLSIWDSDRYLHVTYSHAFNFIKPDVIIFLGDLFDEGSISSNLEFANYVERLYNIFNVEENNGIQHVWLPGDNDIGGEGLDIATAKKIEKFVHTFPQPDTVQHRNTTFYIINRIFQYIPKPIDNKSFLNISTIKIGLSHLPVIISYSTFTDKVLNTLQLHATFTAHEHKSKIIKYHITDKTNKQTIITTPKEPKKVSYTLGIDYVYEFIGPTCSYRMGTPDIGYGFAIIENDDLQYTVLWSPPRFPTLILYCVLLPLLLGFLLIKLYSRKNVIQY